jgi:fucose permease
MLQEVTAVTIASAFVFGMVLALLGSIKLPLAERLLLGEERVAGLLSALNLALIPMMLVSGILVDELGVKGVLLVGAIVTAFGIFLLALSRTYVGSLGAILLAGTGGSCLSTASSVLMIRAFFPDNPAASVNMGNVFFGLGALATPTLVEWLIRTLGFRRALSLLALVCLTPAALAVFTPGESFNVPGERGDLWAVLSNPVLWMVGLAFWLYGPLEGSLGTWATTYLTEVGYKERRAALFLSGFWLTFLAARLVTALLQQANRMPIADAWLIVFLALGAAVLLGNMAGATMRGRAGLGLLLVGVTFGPIFPTLVGILFGHFEPRQHGTAFGAMFAIGATGSLVVPPLIGAYARRTSVRDAMRIPMVTALALALVTLVLGLALPLWR